MKVSKKVVVGLSIGVGVLAIVGIVLTIGTLQDLSFSQEMLQKKLSSKLPMEKYGNNYKMTIESINLEIKGRPIMTMAGSVESFGKTMKVELETAGDLQCSGRVLFFRSPGMLVKSLSFSGAEVSGLNKKIISVGVSTAASLYLNNFPLHKIKGTKGWLIGAAIKSIEFGDGVVDIRLSLFQLTVSVFSFLFTLLISVALALVIVLKPTMCSEWL